MGGDDADVGGRMVAQLADIAGGLQALGAAASAPPPEPPPAPDPVVRFDDGLPEVIRAAVAPLIEAIRATHDAMRASHAQQSQATDAVLRVISAVRPVPAPAERTVAVAVPVAAASGEAAAVAVQPVTSVAAVYPEPVPAAATVAAEPVSAAGAGVSLPPPPPEAEPRVEETLQNIPIIGAEPKPLRVWPPSR